MINKNIKCPSCHNSLILKRTYAEIRAQIKDIEIESSVKRMDELLTSKKNKTCKRRDKKQQRQLIMIKNKKLAYSQWS